MKGEYNEEKLLSIITLLVNRIEYLYAQASGFIGVNEILENQKEINELNNDAKTMVERTRNFLKDPQVNNATALEIVCNGKGGIS